MSGIVWVGEKEMRIRLLRCSGGTRMADSTRDGSSEWLLHADPCDTQYHDAARSAIICRDGTPGKASARM